MSDKFNIEKIIKEIPNDIKNKTKIDENLEAMKKEKKVKEKEKLLNEIKNEIEKIKQNTYISPYDKEKLKEVKNQLDIFKTSLDSLKKQVQNKTNMSKDKILEVTDKMEEEGLFGKDDKGIGGWFRSIIKWFEEFLGGFGISKASSNDKIAKTFEKLGYGENEKIIKKVLTVIRKIPLDKLEEKIKGLDFEKLEPKSDDNSLWKKFLDLPVVKDIVDFVNEHLGNNEKIDTLEEKKVALKILKTVVLNKDLIKGNSDSAGGLVAGIENKIKSTVDSKLGLTTNTSGKPTVGTVIDKMFDHGISDKLRDYALPSKGVKLINYGNPDIDSENSEIKNIKVTKQTSTEMQFTYSKVNKSKGGETDKSKGNKKGNEKLKPKLTAEIKIEGNNIIIEKGGKKYEFESGSGTKWGLTGYFSKEDIENLKRTKDGLKFSVDAHVNILIGQITKKITKTIKTNILAEGISRIGPQNLIIKVGQIKIKFKEIS